MSASVRPLDRPIVLFGPMASGKSSVGAALAAILGAEFLDTDALVVAAHGPIPEIFATRGEEAFRRAEAEVIAAVLGGPHPRGLVLALGGGSVLREDTRARLAGTHRVYLRADWDDVAPRLVGSADRPLLHGDAENSWKALMDRRRPVFESLASLSVDTGHSTAAEVATHIASEIAAGKRRIDEGVIA
ncbi:shikimate kinase [Sinomonas cyclohexanicum]|uniref:Shikimate kinase n=1 Tax=Sinomonas cyclohexanicum TaxID=322009 RepID=A0ABN6FIE1_SINCY|nr:shikimate kinase [Corynebacterium cyclohexanicum]BCT76340.1 shikimate kinase [Corynebacterium cyclohexanicum]